VTLKPASVALDTFRHLVGPRLLNLSEFSKKTVDVGAASLDVVKNQDQRDDTDNQPADPQNDHRGEASARPLTAGLKPTQVILVWSGESVDSHKTSKKYPLNR
jgi:hypothetical protein